MTTPDGEPAVLHLLVRSQGGGTETNVRALCEAVPSFEALSMESVLGWPLNWLRLRQMVRALRSQPPDVVFCYGITAHVMGVVAFPFGPPAMVGNIRCVSDFDGIRGVLRWLVRRRFSRWVSNSKAAAWGKDCEVIYNGVEEPPEEEPAYPDLPKPVFGMLASGHPKKGHRFFLDLWRSLGKPGSLVFAGDLGRDLRLQAVKEGVLCPGYVQAGPVLRSLDLLVVPSTAEGLPTVLLEAMVRGVPCLAAPAGGIAELIRHGRNGYLIPRREWEGLIREMDWDEAREVGRQGREVVLRDFRFDRMKEEFLRVARDVSVSS